MKHPLWVVGIGLCAGMVLLTIHLANLTWDLVSSNALKNAALYSEALTEFRTLYTSEVVSRVQPHGVDIAHDYQMRPGAIPLPATLSIILGQSIAEHGSGGKVKLYSDYPFPWRKKKRQPLDEFEINALNYLRENPTEPYYRFDDNQDVSILRYATADRMRPQCVACHNNHADTPRKGWKTGDVRGVLSITLPIDQLFVRTQEQLWQTFFLMILVLSITLIGIGLALRMARARILAEETNRVKAQFLVNVSHELRTPLNGVLGLAELLKKTALDSRQNNYVKLLINSGRHLHIVINDLLDLSKLEADRVYLENIDFFIEDLIVEVLELLSPAAAEKKLEMGYEIASDLPDAFQGDPSRLGQILTNLLSNAVKFTEKGQVVIRIQPGRVEEGICHLMFEVQDTGIGIEKQKEDRLFRPFSQADDSHTRRFGGTGLGLKISKDLVELMNGTIGVKNNDAHGSIFWFEIPLPISNKEKQDNLDPTPLQGQRLLFLGKNNVNGNMISAYAKSWGMIVETTQDATKAWSLLTSCVDDNPFTYVIVDVELSQTQKADLFHRIHKDARFNNLEILFCSFMSSTSSVLDFQLARPATIITKPIKKTFLLELLLTLCNKQHDATLAKTESFAEPFIGKKILIAEDNAVNQEVIVAMVSHLGYTYDVVENGRGVLKAYQQNDYHLILMDCQMPDMDGYQTTKQIRENENVENRTTIIAISAHATQEAIDQAKSVGMDDYLTKPVSLQNLQTMLDKWA